MQSHHCWNYIHTHDCAYERIDSTDKEVEIDSGAIHPEDYEITEKFEMVSGI